MTIREMYEWAREFNALDLDMVLYDEQVEPESIEIDYIINFNDVIVCSTRSY